MVPDTELINGFIHVAISYDKVTQAIDCYRNGQLFQTIDVSNQDELYFGGQLLFRGGSFSGARLFDDFIFYQEPLSALQVSEIYQRGELGGCASSFDLPALNNEAPEVAVRGRYTISLDEPTVVLQALATDDQLPNGSSLSYSWSYLSGPTTSTISNSNVLNPVLSVTEAGNYRYQLRVSDGELETISSDVRVRVLTVNGNAAPTVNAGVDQTLQIGDTVVLAGTASDDGLPSSTLSYEWFQTGGPFSLALSDATSLTPEFVATAAGRYTLELRANDGELTSFDRVEVLIVQDINEAPIVDAGADLVLELPNNELQLVGSFTDDGHPRGADLETSWLISSGPTSVEFEDFDGFAVNVTFSQPGTYTFVYRVDDTSLVSTDTVTVEVLADATPAVNQAPLVDLGNNLVLDVATLELSPSVSDDGLPSNTLVYNWRTLSGPAPINVQTDNASNSASLLFSYPGDYELELVVDDGELFGSDRISITVPESVISPRNRAPIVEVVESLSVNLGSGIVNLPVVANDDNGVVGLTFLWELVEGPDNVSVSTDTNGEGEFIPTSLGDYVMQVTVSDGELSVTALSTVTVVPAGNSAPVVDVGSDQIVEEFTEITLSGAVNDDGLPSNSLTYTWEQVAGPGFESEILNPDQASTVVRVGGFGNYIYRLIVSDGELESSDYLVISATGVPVVEVTSPESGGVLTDDRDLLLAANAYKAGTSVQSVEFYEAGSLIGEGTVIPGSVTYVYRGQMLSKGEHSVYAVAQYTDGSDQTSSVVDFEVIDLDEDQLLVELTSPNEDTDLVTEPVDIMGSATSRFLDTWSVELRKEGESQWKEILSGANSVANQSFGLLDPSLLQNGLYYLRVTATSSTGLSSITPEQSITIDGQMKIGHFALAFEDLSVPISGVPLSVTRTYDSRDATEGDFGPAWEVGLKSVSVSTNGNLGDTWSQSSNIAGYFSYFCVEPQRRHRVMIRFPDGRTEIFEAKISIPEDLRSFLGSTWPENCQLINPISGTQLAFEPDGKSQGKLEVLGDPTVLWQSLGGSGSFNGPGQWVDASLNPFDPQVFQYTENDGTVYVISKTDGLISMTDTNGNTLTINDSGVHHSDGESLLFTRDATNQNRITHVTDPAGNAVQYGYDAEGRLSTVTNRENESKRPTKHH